MATEQLHTGTSDRRSDKIIWRFSSSAYITYVFKALKKYEKVNSICVTSKWKTFFFLLKTREKKVVEKTLKNCSKCHILSSSLGHSASLETPSCSWLLHVMIWHLSLSHRPEGRHWHLQKEQRHHRENIRKCHFFRTIGLKVALVPCTTQKTKKWKSFFSSHIHIVVIFQDSFPF